MTLKRFIRVMFYTFSMYVMTHILVFILLPIGIIMVAIAPASIPKLKKFFTGLLFRIVGKRLRVSGLDHLEEGKQYLIISNYPSFYAGFAMINVFPEAAVVAHAFIKKIPLLGFFMKRIGTIFVNPSKGKRSAHAIDMGLSKQEARSIIIFPEGERSPDSSIHRFKRGFIYILRSSALDLLPVTLSGFYRLKPIKRMYLDPDAQPKIIVHSPLKNMEARRMSDKELLETATNIIQSAYIA